MGLKELEKRFGLPPLDKGLGMVAGPMGRRLNTLLTRLEKLAQDKEAIRDVLTLLQLVQELDKAGTLERLNTLLKELGPLTKGKTARQFLDKLEKFERLAEVLLKEE